MNFIHKPLMSGIAICLTFFAYSCATPEKTENKTDFTAYVDPYIGSGEHGHVFVGANVPFGAVQVGPQNIFKGWDWCSGYHYSDSIIIGFSHTHLSGTGCSDLGDILLMPYTVNVTPRFKVLQAVDCPDLGREKGKWYTAVPPLARCVAWNSFCRSRAFP